MEKMKHIIHLFATNCLMMLFVAMASCSGEANFSSVQQDVPKILTYGFYAEDNPDVLSKDYVVDLTNVLTLGTSTVNIEVPMPPMVDKSALVARFTTAEGTSVTVKGVAQESMVTVNDFTVPVDYLLTKENVNVRFAVTVTKSMDMKWTETPLFDALTTYGSPIMKIHPQSNKPYVAFKVRSDNDYRPVVLSYDGQAWNYVGSGAFGHKVSNSYLDFSISPAGIPYIAYADDELTTTATTLNGAMSVMAFTDGQWGYVGNAGVLKAQSTYIGFAALNDVLVAGQVNNSASGNFTRRSLVVSEYKNGTWNSETPAILTNSVFSLVMANTDDVAYMFSINRGVVSGVNYGYNVTKYANGQWTNMLANALEEGATQNSPYIAGCTVGANGVPYIWFGDNATGTYEIRVKYYDAATDKWLTLAGNTLPLGFAFDRNTEVALAVTEDGTPYVVYNNKSDQNYPYFMYLDADTKQWSTPVRIAEISASGLNFEFSKTGVGYVTFADNDNHIRTFVYE